MCFSYSTEIGYLNRMTHKMNALTSLLLLMLFYLYSSTTIFISSLRLSILTLCCAWCCSGMRFAPDDFTTAKQLFLFYLQLQLMRIVREMNGRKLIRIEMRKCGGEMTNKTTKMPTVFLCVCFESNAQKVIHLTRKKKKYSVICILHRWNGYVRLSGRFYTSVSGIERKGAKFQSVVFKRDGFAVEPKVSTTKIVAIALRFEFSIWFGRHIANET